MENVNTYDDRISSIKIGNKIYAKVFDYGQQTNGIIPIKTVKNDYQTFDSNFVYTNSITANNTSKEKIEITRDSNGVFSLMKIGKARIENQGELEDCQIFIKPYTKTDVGENQGNDNNSNPSVPSSSITKMDEVEFKQLLSLLQVFQISYDNQISEDDKMLSFQGNNVTHSLSCGLKYHHIKENFANVNCIRMKNTHTGNIEYPDNNIYLQIFQIPYTVGSLNYDESATSGQFISISRNTVNLSLNKMDKQFYYQWYFGKTFELKSDRVYIILPTLEKTLSTEYDGAKFIIQHSTEQNSSSQSRIWIGNRDVDSDGNITPTNTINRQPIIQFCRKEPTTVTLKK